MSRPCCPECGSVCLTPNRDGSYYCKLCRQRVEEPDTTEKARHKPGTGLAAEVWDLGGDSS